MKKKLIAVSYSDPENKVRLDAYADMLAYDDDYQLIAIRLGGYPEVVRALSDTIYGGGTIHVESDGQQLTLYSLRKQYTRHLNRDGIYAETVLTVNDKQSETETMPEQKKLTSKACKGGNIRYIFCRAGDSDALYKAIDQKSNIPMIPSFKEYLLQTLQERKQLVRLHVHSCTEKLEAWMLDRGDEDCFIRSAIEDGLKSSAIAIPGSTAQNTGIFKEIHTVSQYLNQFGPTVAERIKSEFRPLYDPAAEPISKPLASINLHIQEKAGYSLYDAQLASAEALKRSLDKKGLGLLVADCGTGKTKIGVSALYAHQLEKGKEKVFNVILCPSHMTRKWVREIHETIPRAAAATITSIRELKKFYAAFEKGKGPAFAIISKEQARDGYMRYPAVQYSPRDRFYHCPHCFVPVEIPLSKKEKDYLIPASASDFVTENEKNRRCRICGNSLWSALNPAMQSEWVRIGGLGYISRRSPNIALAKTPQQREQILKIQENPAGNYAALGAVRRFPLSTYIKRKMKGKIDGFLADELHQFNNNSGQGDAMGELVKAAKAVVGMTATLINGYASGIFYLLYRIAPHLMQLDGKPFEEPGKFSAEYGVIEQSYQVDAGEEDEYNDMRRTVRRNVRTRQLPGVSPLIYTRFLMECTVFLSLFDLKEGLPEYEEIPVGLPMQPLAAGEYSRLQGEFTSCLKDKDIGRRLLSSMLSTLTIYPDQPYHQPPALHPRTRQPLIVPVDTCSPDTLQAKEEKTLEIIRDKVQKGEHVLVYTAWTRSDSQQKLMRLLDEQGYQSAILPASVAPKNREEWVEKKLKNGLQVLITNPRIVETGLDLNDLTTIIFFSFDYNLFTLRQASRRSLRINQTAPRIEVYLLYYQGTIQENAISLMATKLAVAGIIGGNISDEGLAAMGNCQDLSSQLAHELAMGIRHNSDTIKSSFHRMAILHPQTEKKAIEAAVKPETTPAKSQGRQEASSAVILQFAEGFRRTSRKKATAAPPPGQLSLEELLSA